MVEQINPKSRAHNITHKPYVHDRTQTLCEHCKVKAKANPKRRVMQRQCKTNQGRARANNGKIRQIAQQQQ